jgi:hypothetical protein
MAFVRRQSKLSVSNTPFHGFFVLNIGHRPRQLGRVGPDTKLAVQYSLDGLERCLKSVEDTFDFFRRKLFGFDVALS